MTRSTDVATSLGAQDVLRGTSKVLIRLIYLIKRPNKRKKNKKNTHKSVSWDVCQALTHDTHSTLLHN